MLLKGDPFVNFAGGNISGICEEVGILLVELCLSFQMGITDFLQKELKKKL